MNAYELTHGPDEPCTSPYLLVPFYTPIGTRYGWMRQGGLSHSGNITFCMSGPIPCAMEGCNQMERGSVRFVVPQGIMDVPYCLEHGEPLSGFVRREWRG